MSFDLIYTRNNTNPGRTLGENVFFGKLPNDSKVFVFYYPHESLPFIALTDGLKAYGSSSGNDIFVNIGKIGVDPYSKMVKEFEVGPLPVIIVTGTPVKACITTEGAGHTAFVRLDNKNLFKNVDRTMGVVAEIVNLFMAEKIIEASKKAANAQKMAALGLFKDSIISLLRNIEEVSVGLLDGTFSLKFRSS